MWYTKGAASADIIWEVLAMLAFIYGTKAELKKSIGKRLAYHETSISGIEFKPDGELTGVGPSEYNRKWYANVTMVNGLIAKVK